MSSGSGPIGYGVAHPSVSASTIAATGRSGMVTCQMPATARMTIMTANQRQSMSTPYRSRCAPRLSLPFTAEVLASKLSGIQVAARRYGPLVTHPNGRNDSPILVIGAGVVGASIAYHLARVGLRVTVLEHGSVAGRGDRQLLCLGRPLEECRRNLLRSVPARRCSRNRPPGARTRRAIRFAPQRRDHLGRDGSGDPSVRRCSSSTRPSRRPHR